MSNFEAIIAWSSTVAYAMSSMAFVYAIAFRKTKAQMVALWIAVPALLLHIGAIVVRTRATGHLPVEGIYENALTAAFCIAVPALVVAFRSEGYRPLALAAIPLALFMMGFGLMKFDRGGPLPPPFQSSWLVIHVVFAQIAYGAYAIATGAGVIYLIKSRREKLGVSGGFLEKMPSPPNLEDFIFRLVVFGFITSAMMTIAGAFWADALWGSYWSWDPVETWSLISWLIYGIFIHLRLIHRWEGPRVAWYVIAAMITVIIAYWGADSFTTRSHIGGFE